MNTSAELLKELRIDRKAPPAPPPSRRGLWTGLAIAVVVALLVGAGWFLFGRDKAIEALIDRARAGDVVVLAGKGHEDYQEIHGVRLPFSDIREAARVLAAGEVPHA